VGLSQHAWGLADQYTVTDLGTAQATTLATEGGLVAGTVQDAQGQPIAHELWPQLIPAGTLPNGLFSFALGAHDSRIVGFSGTGAFSLHSHAYVWDQASGIQDLGTEELFSAATTLNIDDIAGYADSADQTHTVPVVWLDGEDIVALPTLGSTNGQITAMNEAGELTGFSTTASGETHCTFWPAAGGVVDCHAPNGGATSLGLDLNSTAQIVGSAEPPEGTRGFVRLPWGMILLPPLTDGTRSAAYGINDYGEIVGESWTPGACGNCPRPGQAAVVWSNGTPLKLQDRLVNAPGWGLTRALAIDNDGQILVVGTLNGQDHSALLTPVDSPVTAWYKWQARIQRHYQAQFDHWRKQIVWYYRPEFARAQGR